MNIHILTIGQPKLDYAKRGWDEYWKRLGHFHTLRTTHLADKHNDAKHISAAVRQTFVIVLVIDGTPLSSVGLADFLQKRAIMGQEASFIIGGPEGLPAGIIEQADYRLSLGPLTLPHDLAMVVLLEALYRASTINAGLPYHK